MHFDHHVVNLKLGQPPGVVSLWAELCHRSLQTIVLSVNIIFGARAWPHLTSPDLTMTSWSCSGQQVSPDQDSGWLLLLRVRAAGALPRPRPQRRGDGPRHDRRHRQRGRGHGRRPQHAGKYWISIINDLWLRKYFKVCGKYLKVIEKYLWLCEWLNKYFKVIEIFKTCVCTHLNKNICDKNICRWVSTAGGFCAACWGCGSGSTTCGPTTWRWPTTWRRGARRGGSTSPRPPWTTSARSTRSSPAWDTPGTSTSGTVTVILFSLQTLCAVLAYE